VLRENLALQASIDSELTDLPDLAQQASIRHADVPARQQIAETLALLRSTLEEAGVSIDRVVRIDAYLSDADLVPVWNELYLEVWPEPGPARITLVAGFVAPQIHFELMATAVR